MTSNTSADDGKPAAPVATTLGTIGGGSTASSTATSRPPLQGSQLGSRHYPCTVDWFLSTLRASFRQASQEASIAVGRELGSEGGLPTEALTGTVGSRLSPLQNVMWKAITFALLPPPEEGHGGGLLSPSGGTKARQYHRAVAAMRHRKHSVIEDSLSWSPIRLCSPDRYQTLGGNEEEMMTMSFNPTSHIAMLRATLPGTAAALLSGKKHLGEEKKKDKEGRGLSPPQEQVPPKRREFHMLDPLLPVMELALEGVQQVIQRYHRPNNSPYGVSTSIPPTPNAAAAVGGNNNSMSFTGSTPLKEIGIHHGASLSGSSCANFSFVKDVRQVEQEEQASKAQMGSAVSRRDIYDLVLQHEQRWCVFLLSSWKTASDAQAAVQQRRRQEEEAKTLHEISPPSDNNNSHSVTTVEETTQLLQRRFGRLNDDIQALSSPLRLSSALAQKLNRRFNEGLDSQPPPTHRPSLDDVPLESMKSSPQKSGMPPGRGSSVVVDASVRPAMPLPDYVPVLWVDWLRSTPPDGAVEGHMPSATTAAAAGVDASWRDVMFAAYHRFCLESPSVETTMTSVLHCLGMAASKADTTLISSSSGSSNSRLISATHQPTASERSWLAIMAALPASDIPTVVAVVVLCCRMLQWEAWVETSLLGDGLWRAAAPRRAKDLPLPESPRRPMPSQSKIELNVSDTRDSRTTDVIFTRLATTFSATERASTPPVVAPYLGGIITGISSVVSFHDALIVKALHLARVKPLRIDVSSSAADITATSALSVSSTLTSFSAAKSCFSRPLMSSVAIDGASWKDEILQRRWGATMEGTSTVPSSAAAAVPTSTFDDVKEERLTANDATKGAAVAVLERPKAVGMKPPTLSQCLELRDDLTPSSTVALGGLRNSAIGMDRRVEDRQRFEPALPHAEGCMSEAQWDMTRLYLSSLRRIVAAHPEVALHHSAAGAASSPEPLYPRHRKRLFVAAAPRL